MVVVRSGRPLQRGSHPSCTTRGADVTIIRADRVLLQRRTVLLLRLRTNRRVMFIIHSPPGCRGVRCAHARYVTRATWFPGRPRGVRNVVLIFRIFFFIFFYRYDDINRHARSSRVFTLDFVFVTVNPMNSFVRTRTIHIFIFLKLHGPVKTAVKKIARATASRNRAKRGKRNKWKLLKTKKKNA